MPTPNLSQPEMAIANQHWLDEGRPFIERQPSMTSLFPVMEDLARAFIADQVDPQAEVRERAAAVAVRVARFDDDARALDALLRGHALIERNPERRAAIDTARENLLPGGLAIITRSVTEKAAEAQLMPARIDDDERALLADLPAAAGSVLDFIEGTFVPETEALGDAQAQRMDAEARASHRTRGFNLETRRRFVQLDATMRNLAALHGMDPETHRAIFGFVDQLVAQADRRVQARRTTQQGARGGAAPAAPDAPPAEAAPAAGADDPPPAGPSPVLRPVTPQSLPGGGAGASEGGGSSSEPGSSEQDG